MVVPVVVPDEIMHGRRANSAGTGTGTAAAASATESRAANTGRDIVFRAESDL